jgi:hypothetical protein
MCEGVSLDLCLPLLLQMSPLTVRMIESIQYLHRDNGPLSKPGLPGYLRQLFYVRANVLQIC